MNRSRLLPKTIAEMMEREHIYTICDLSVVSVADLNRIYYWLKTGRLTGETAEKLARVLKCDPHVLGTLVRLEDRANGKTTKKATLCWTCQNAVPDKEGHGCKWSRELKPVDGWTADETMCGQIQSYCVLKCPEYLEDEQ